MRTRIKFCGCMSAADVDAAVGCGVDAVGVIFAQASPRRVAVAAAQAIAQGVPAFVSLVAVFADNGAQDVQTVVDAGFMPQFHGDEPPAACARAGAARYIKVFHVAEDAASRIDAEAFERAAAAYPGATWMFDTAVGSRRGGTGQTFDWGRLRDVAADRRIIVSGGLTPGNVGACVRQIRPYGVDVRSGIETGGVKDPEKMRAFVRAVKEADEQT